MGRFRRRTALFVIINARALSERTEEASRREADTSRIEQEVLEKRKDLILVKNMMEETNREAEYTRGLSSSIEKELEGKRGELSKYRGETLAGKQRANRLKADIRSLEEDYTRLKAAAIDADGGMNIKEFRGDGDRQYLTGVKLGGERILVLVDASASMLANDPTNALIYPCRIDPQRLLCSLQRLTVLFVTFDNLCNGLPVLLCTFIQRAELF